MLYHMLCSPKRSQSARRLLFSGGGGRTLRRDTAGRTVACGGGGGGGSSTNSSSTDETEARERRFGSIDLQPLTSGRAAPPGSSGGIRVITSAEPPSQPAQPTADARLRQALLADFGTLCTCRWCSCLILPVMPPSGR